MKNKKRPASLSPNQAFRRTIPIAFPELDGEYLSPAAAALRLHISKRTLLRWRKHGWIPFVRVKGRVHLNWRHVTQCIDRFFRVAAKELEVTIKNENSDFSKRIVYSRRK